MKSNAKEITFCLYHKITRDGREFSKSSIVPPSGQNLNLIP